MKNIEILACILYQNVINLKTEFILKYLPSLLDWLSTKSNSNQLKRRYESMEDITLLCKDCGKEFVFTVGEQEFFAEKGFTNQPVRCQACRKARKQQNGNKY